MTALDVIREIEALPDADQKVVAAYVQHRSDPRRMSHEDFAELVRTFQNTREGTPEADALWGRVVEEVFDAAASDARPATDTAAA